MEVFRIWLEKGKEFFYDPYTGYKKIRIGIAGGIVTLLSIILLLMLYGLPDKKGLPDHNIDGLEQTTPDITESVKKEIPGVTSGGSVIVEDAILPDPAVNLGVDSEWVWEDGWGKPVIGDLEALGGDVTEAAAEVSNAESYSSWDSEFELQGVVRVALEKVLYNYLLSMDTVLMQGKGMGFAADMSVVLLDAPAIGEQVREYMSEEAAGIWEVLEPVYIQLYTEIYMCENETELVVVAEGETRKLATELTYQFMEAVNRERTGFMELDDTAD